MAGARVSEQAVSEATDAARVVRVDGDLDAESMPAVQARVQAALDAGVRGVVIDASRIRYASSAALLVLARFAARARAAGSVLRIAAPSAKLADLLALLALGDLDVRADVGEALLDLQADLD